MKKITLIPTDTKNHLTKKFSGMSDQQLVEAARQGNENAGVCLIYVRYGKSIVDAVRKTYFADEQEYAAIDTASHIWEDCQKHNWTNLDGIENIQSYIYNMAWYMSARNSKRELNRTNNLVSCSGTTKCEDSYYDEVTRPEIEIRDTSDEELEAAIERNQILDNLDKMRAQLTPAEKYVIDCHVLNDVPIATIALEMPREIRPEPYNRFDRPISSYLVQKLYDETVDKLRQAA